MTKIIPFLKPSIPVSDRFPEIYKNGIFTNNGPFCQELENNFKSYLNVENAVLTSNGTITLMMALKALNITGKVLVPSFTFVATVSVLKWLGLSYSFVDIDDSLTIDPNDLESKDDIECLIAVSAFGNPCKIKEITEICVRKGIKLIFDSAGALGSSYNNLYLGNFGEVESFSLHATKVCSAVEGGLLTTNNNELAEKLRLYRNFGIKYLTVDDIGINAKISEFHSAIGIESLKNLKDNIEKREKIASIYRTLPVKFQTLNGKTTNQLFPILVDKRDELKEYLEQYGVYTRIYYDPLLNENKIYSNGDKTPFAKEIHSKILCLPLYPSLEEEDINFICELIERFI